jgi:hypothetical protein
VKFLLYALLGLLIYEGSVELARLHRWSSEDPMSWRRKVVYRAELEANKWTA